MSFVLNTGIWLVTLYFLNTLIIDKICNRKCSSRSPRSGPSAYYHWTGRRNAKDDIPHCHKSPREIHAYSPTSRWTRPLICSKFYTTFLYSFGALLRDIWLWINKTLGVLTFLGHSVWHWRSHQCGEREMLIASRTHHAVTDTHCRLTDAVSEHTVNFFLSSSAFTCWWLQTQHNANGIILYTDSQ